MKCSLFSEAARELNVSATTIREMERRGDLPAVRTAGGTRVFSDVDIEKAKQLKAQRGEKNRKRG